MRRRTLEGRKLWKFWKEKIQKKSGDRNFSINQKKNHE